MTTIIQVLPLPNNIKLTASNTDVSGIFYDDSNPSYTPNGTYIATSSSYGSKETKAYNIFNGKTTSKWRSDFYKNPDYNENTFANPKYTQTPYTGDTPSTYRGGGNIKTKYVTKIGSGYNSTQHYGEWVQIKLPYSVYIYRYSLLTPELPNGINSFPKKFILAGSTDGEKWDIVHMRDYTEIPVCNGSPIIYNINSTNSYSYYRIIVTELADRQTIVAISQWNIFGTIRQTTNKETFSNVKENFYGLKTITEGASTISAPDININGPFADKYITDICTANNGNNVFTKNQDAIESLRKTYPNCQGITKETVNTLITPPSNCAIMTMPGLVTTTGTNDGVGALLLDGTPDQYVTLPAIKTTNTGLTFTLWFKSDNNKDGAKLFDIGNNGESNNIFIAINNNKLLAGFKSNSKWVSNTNINDNTWHHIVWTISPGSDNDIGTWKFYLDGTLVNSVNGYIPPANVYKQSYIGKSNHDWDPTYNGMIKEFRIYHSELSSTDIQYLYNYAKIADYYDEYVTTYDVIKNPYLYYSFGISTVTNGTGVNSINTPIVKKSIQYTLRGSNNLMNFADLDDSKKKTMTNQEGGSVQTWKDNVSAWTTTKRMSESFLTKADIDATLITPLKQSSVDYNALLTKINRRYNDISGNVNLITNSGGTGVRDVMLENDQYDYSGDSLNALNKKPRLQDGMKDDSLSMLSQQNSVFILGTICSTALLILAISLASE